MGKGCEQAFLQGGYINSQYTPEKMLYNISHQGHANHDLEIPLHTHKDGQNKKSDNNKCWKDVGKSEPLYTASGNIKWFSCLGKQPGISPGD